MSNRRRPKIAVIDDDEAVRDSLAGLARSLGHDADCFANAEAFLRTVYAREFGCMAVEVQLPGMSGVELARTLAERGRPVAPIFMSGNPRFSRSQLPATVSPIGIIHKPIDADSMVRFMLLGLVSDFR